MPIPYTSPTHAARSAHATMPRDRTLPFAGDVFSAWTLRELAVCPWDGFWPFNPSIVRTRDGRWLVSVRCADYCMPGGRPWVAPTGKIQNRNVIAELDDTLAVIAVHEMREAHDTPIVSTKVSGVEDLRLFETVDDGLVAIATAMQFNRDGKQEIVLLELDAAFQIVEATPLRGLWSKTHQKNWTPYDKTDHVRLLYSVERGGIHDGHGMIAPRHGVQIPPMDIDDAAIGVHTYLGRDARDMRNAHGSTSQLRSATPNTYRNGSLETRVLRRHPRMNGHDGATKLDAGPFSLRGGSQLVSLAPVGKKGRWLGIGHGVRVFGTQKFYWHVFYTVCDRGILRERSAPVKLAETGIEFAAGLALDIERGRVVISFGTDDECAWLGATTIDDVLRTLAPLSAHVAHDSSDEVQP